ncbi:MAG: hypothetical protein ABI769_07710 [Pseudomonadota bacterium]
MSTPLPDAPVEQWLSALERALGSLPVEDSWEIVTEAREHISERIRTGVSSTEALTGFGSADAYAQSFKDEHLLNSARASKRTIPMLRTVIRFAGRSSVAVIGLIGTIVLGFFGVWSLACIGIKLFRPKLVGLWLDFPLSEPHRYEHSQRDFIPLSFGHDHIVFGFQNPPPGFAEYLGLWVYPCLAAIALLSYLALRAILRTAVKRIRMPTRA